MQARAAAGNQAATFGRAKACIILFMWGGPAHQDTWDLKPDAPSGYKGEFTPTRTKLPGLLVNEHMPMMAARADRLTVIRSMTHTDVNHTTAPHRLLTGKPAVPGSQLADNWPSYGAILSQQGRSTGPLPPFVSMMPVSPDNAPRFVEETHGQGSGILGPTYNPLKITADPSRADYRVGDVALRADVPLARAHRRQELLQQLNGQAVRFDQVAEHATLDGHYRRAFEMLSSPKALSAFDLTKEPLAVRERYGLNIHGQAVLQARRLVEAGVPLITVFWQNDGLTNVSVYWDTHRRNFIDLKTRLCPPADQAFAALLDDLEDRGMLDETLVIWTGEMGRTPRLGQTVVGGAGAGPDSRDHWPHCFTSILAGGGAGRGVLYGASDRYAAYPAVNPVSAPDFVATVYHLLGVNPHQEIHDKLGRPLTLCEGTPIRELMA
jgi:hypothetical protein